jgi:hypothetical protein
MTRCSRPTADLQAEWLGGKTAEAKGLDKWSYNAEFQVLGNRLKHGADQARAKLGVWGNLDIINDK